jgi:hypothetical protein
MADDKKWVGEYIKVTRLLFEPGLVPYKDIAYGTVYSMADDPIDLFIKTMADEQIFLVSGETYTKEPDDNEMCIVYNAEITLTRRVV